jgi:hypothetical protein
MLYITSLVTLSWRHIFEFTQPDLNSNNLKEEQKKTENRKGESERERERERG